MKKFFYLIALALTVTACGPKHISDIKDAIVEVVQTGHDERYQWVSDPATSLTGLADMDGKIFIPVKYKDIEVFCLDDKNYDFFVVINDEDLKGVYNAEGKQIIPEKFSHIHLNTENNMVYFSVFAQRVYNEKYTIQSESSGKKKEFVDNTTYTARGIFDFKGRVLVPCEFEEILPLKDYIFKVKALKRQESRFYYGVYKDGKELVPCKYKEVKVTDSCNGAVACTAVGDSYTWEAFDFESGSKTLIPYSKVSLSVTDHYITLRKKNSDNLYVTELIDFKGNVIIPGEKYPSVGEIDNVFFCGNHYNTFLFDKDMKPIFDEEGYFFEYKEGVLIATKSDLSERGILGMDGKWILPCDKNYQKIDIKSGKVTVVTRNYQKKEFILY